MIYLIGSLRNPEVPKIANNLRQNGLEVFDDWYAAGEIADDSWRDYEKAKGSTFREALKGAAARNVFEFDKRYLTCAEQVALICPAGKSGHLELGWALGQGKPGYILLDDPDRWDVMYQFATGVCYTVEELLQCLKSTTNTIETPQKLPFMLEDPVGGEIPSASIPNVKELIERKYSENTENGSCIQTGPFSTTWLEKNLRVKT